MSNVVSMSLKLQIVRQIEQGELSTTAAQRQYGIQEVDWLRKFGTFDWENKIPSHYSLKTISYVV